MSESIIADPESLQKYIDFTNSEYTRYKSDREDIDTKNEWADYMYACAQNRGKMSSDQADKIGRAKDTRSSLGSVIFHRQVNALAAQLVQVAKSQPDLWRYSPAYNDGQPLSDQDAKSRSDLANAMARWIRRKDGFDKKIPEFATSIYKNSNIPVMIQQRVRYKRITITEPVYETQQDPTTGEPISVLVDERQVEKEVVVENYPSVTLPHWSMVYADRYISSLPNQNCVIVLSLVTRTELQSEVSSGFLDEKEFEKVTEDFMWDGSEGSEQLKREAQNRGKDFQPGKGLYLRWDTYARVPMKDGGKWDDNENHVLMWGTHIGNTLDSAITLALDYCPDPDGEIPLEMIRANPDRSEELYHTTTAEVVRSLYAADTTLMNLGIDNIVNCIDPPMMVVDGQHRIRDFRIFAGQRFHVDNLNALKPFDIRDMTGQLVPMRQQIRQDAREALSTDPAMMGQYAGARTSATEFSEVSRNTKGPHYVQITYILNQLLPWMARKYMSYCEKFVDPNTTFQIADQEKQYKSTFKDSVGEYDVLVDIVDEYQRTESLQREITTIMQTIGTVPYFQQSQTHTTDAGELLRVWMGLLKMRDVSKIILPAQGVDSENAAASRISAILNGGQYTPPVPGENHNIHLRVAEAERLRWRGLENEADPRVANLPLLDQYILELKNMVKTQAGSPPAGQPPMTPGQESGGDLAAQAAGGL